MTAKNVFYFINEKQIISDKTLFAYQAGYWLPLI